MQAVDLVYFDAGGGHRSAAEALLLACGREKRPWLVRLMNLQKVLEPLDVVQRLTGLPTQEFYNVQLRRGWTLGMRWQLRALHGLIRMQHSAAVRVLEEHWRKSPPAMVVSLVPNFNRTMYAGLRRCAPSAPYVTILTDMADTPPHFWFEKQEQYFICPWTRAVSEAQALGHDAKRIFLTSGLMVNPRFYEALEQTVDRASERRRLGLDPLLPTGLLMFGGYGSQDMMCIAERLNDAGLRLQLIVVCGRNEQLVAQFRARRWRIPLFVEGFTRHMPFYMRLADFLIGKPGSTSISEAQVMGLPVIVELNAWTMPQERCNVEWIREKEIGIVVPSFRHIAGAVAKLLAPENFSRIQGNVMAFRNVAICEVPDILHQILSQTTCHPTQNGCEVSCSAD
jgi:1,2-diacylglycerol 3-beta-galactosyltransferase